MDGLINRKNVDKISPIRIGGRDAAELGYALRRKEALPKKLP